MADITAGRGSGGLNWNSAIIVAGFIISTAITLSTVIEKFSAVKMTADSAQTKATAAEAAADAVEHRVTIVEQQTAQASKDVQALEFRLVSTIEGLKRDVARESEETQALLRELVRDDRARER